MFKTNVVLIALGSIFVTLGAIGIFMPVLPTTPFLLLAAVCYGRSSDRLYRKLMEHRILGRYIRSYRDGNGVPLASKILAVSLVWLSIGSSVIFFVKPLLLRIMLVLIASGVTIHILSLKTAVRNKDKTS